MNKKDREQFFNELLYYQHNEVIFYLDDYDYMLGMRYSEDFNVVLFCEQFEKDIWNIRAEFLDGSDGELHFKIDVASMDEYKYPQAYLLCEEWANELIAKL